MKRSKSKVMAIVLTIAMLLAVPGILRVYQIAGASEAPSLVLNDRILVNRAAYDCAVPYTYANLFSWRSPSRGDMVVMRMPGRESGVVGVKRIVALPGDTVELHDNVLSVNGSRCDYEMVDPSEFSWVPDENRLGSVVAVESGSAGGYYVTYTPGSSRNASFGPVTLGEGEYFVLGDNRDASLDSRGFGTIARHDIFGKVVRVLPFRSSRP
jgi:signal peptidase I